MKFIFTGPYERVFICTHCAKTIRAIYHPDVCPRCGEESFRREVAREVREYSKDDCLGSPMKSRWWEFRDQRVEGDGVNQSLTGAEL